MRIEKNMFYKIFADNALSPEQKEAAITKALTFKDPGLLYKFVFAVTNGKVRIPTVNDKASRHYAEFSQYLQTQRAQALRA